MNTPIKAPLITDELIKYMEARFKDQVPDVKDSDRKVWFDAGAVSVVRHLKFIKAKQEENILNITETIT